MLLRLGLPSVSAGRGRFSVSRFPAHARHGADNFMDSKPVSIRPSDFRGTPHARCQHHDAWIGKHDATHQHVPSDCYTRQFGAPSEATVPKIVRYCQTPWELVQKVMIDVPSCPTLVRIGYWRLLAHLSDSDTHCSSCLGGSPHVFPWRLLLLSRSSMRVASLCAKTR